MTPDSKQDRRRSEVVYRAMKEHICQGDYLPGFRLVENDLTGEYHVSRTTIREALRQLLADELVRDLLEIFEVREPLEGLAARLAAKAPPEDKAKLLDIQAATAKAVAVDDRLRFARCNVQFHTTVAEMSENRALRTVLARLNTQLIGFQFLPGYKTVNRERALHDHGVVIDHIVAGEGEKAEAAMRAHLQASRDSVLPIATQEA
jgi:DNA-binding GntR family transcriptional regulator